MTPLARLIAAEIGQNGPMRLSEFMSLCLLHPEHGYYATRDPLGAGGDFVTAPEISQMFGELLGLWLAEVWRADGTPPHVTLAELGPGRGTLMADMLRVAGAVPGCREALDIHLVEASPTLRAIQKETLAAGSPTWHDRAADLPSDRPLYLIANEFFDALPIRQFVRDGPGWRERVVGLTGTDLSFGLSPVSDLPDLDRRFGRVADGTLVETCAPAEAVVTDLVPVIAKQGGAALIIDYGAWDGTGDTLQALRRHEHADVLSDPGTSDLTAHVGFRWLAEAAAPLVATPLAAQGAFLERLGITARAQALAGAATDPDVVARQHRRLTHPDEMGSLFKVLALRPATADAPPGFGP